MKCWASKYGGCDYQSGEHVVSAGLFTGKSVSVRGPAWGTTEAPISIGLNRLKSNILCHQHNSDLSPVDVGGIAAFSTLRDAMALYDRREEMEKARRSPKRWALRRFEIDGSILERWFVKTTINLMHMPGWPKTWAFDGGPAEQPPAVFVDHAYGRAALARPLGLYEVAEVGTNIVPRDGVSIAPFFHQGTGGLGGCGFEFRGCRFLLWLTDCEPPKRDAIAALRDGHVGDPDLLYHVNAFRFARGRQRSSVRIDFSWGARPKGG